MAIAHAFTHPFIPSNISEHQPGTNTHFIILQVRKVRLRGGLISLVRMKLVLTAVFT